MPLTAKADIRDDVLIKISEQSGEDILLQEIATEIAIAESGLDPSVKNPNSTASGVFQFIKGTWREYCEGSVWNYEDNITCGVRMLAEGGYDHWEASKWGKYGWYKTLSPKARHRVATGQIEGNKSIVEPVLNKIISFANGKIYIDNLGNILDKNGAIFKGGEIPFI